MEFIIGVDPGVNNTGIAVLSSKTKTVVHTLLIKRGCEAYEANIMQQVITFCKLLDKNVFAIAVEYPRIYPKTAERANDQMDLAGVAGAYLGAAAAKGIYGYVYYPRDWKGNTPKKISNARILKRLPSLAHCLENFPGGKHEHIIDAAGIALYHITGAK